MSKQDSLGTSECKSGLGARWIYAKWQGIARAKHTDNAVLICVDLIHEESQRPLLDNAFEVAKHQDAHELGSVDLARVVFVNAEERLAQNFPLRLHQPLENRATLADFLVCYRSIRVLILAHLVNFAVKMVGQTIVTIATRGVALSVHLKVVVDALPLWISSRLGLDVHWRQAALQVEQAAGLSSVPRRERGQPLEGAERVPTGLESGHTLDAVLEWQHFHLLAIETAEGLHGHEHIALTPVLLATRNGAVHPLVVIKRGARREGPGGGGAGERIDGRGTRCQGHRRRLQQNCVVRCYDEGKWSARRNRLQKSEVSDETAEKVQRGQPVSQFNSSQLKPREYIR